MTTVKLIGLGVLLGLTVSTSAPEVALGSSLGTGDPQATSRFVTGVITAVDGANVTITPLSGSRPSTGRVQVGRTRIVVNGRSGNPADLKVTYSAHAELGLDDVWESIHIAPRR